MSASSSSSIGKKDCSDYKNESCPKGLTLRITKDTVDIVSMLMVGCWGVYCWDGPIEQLEYSQEDAQIKYSEGKTGSDLFDRKTEIFGQRSVVNGMIEYSKKQHIEALFLAGDNVYNYSIPKDMLIEMLSKHTFPNKKEYKKKYSISGQDIDKQLSEGFSRCMSRLRVERYYIGIGNHDVATCYDLNTQLNYTNAGYNLPATYYNVIYTLAEYKINFIMIDTNVWLEDSCDPEHPYDDSDRNTQLKWIQNVIQEGRCEWNIVVGHAPYKASGHKKKAPAIYNNQLDSIFNDTSQRIQVYMCADEHNQQFLYDINRKLSLVVAGSGGTALDTEIFDPKFTDTKVLYKNPTFGFTVFDFAKDTLQVTYMSSHIGGKSEPVFKVVIKQDGTVMSIE
jgi:hypothetical protein